MTDDGSTVVMCTHLLLEAEGLADQVVVLQDGTNLVAGTPDELTKRYWPARHGAPRRRRPGRPRRARARPRAWSATSGPTAPRCVRLDAPERVPDLVFALTAAGRAAHPGRAPRAHPRGPLLRRAADRPVAAAWARSTGAPSDGRRHRRAGQGRAHPALGARLDRRPHRPQAARPGQGLLDPDADPRRDLLRVRADGAAVHHHPDRQRRRGQPALAGPRGPARAGPGRHPGRHRAGPGRLRARRLPVRPGRRRRAAHDLDRRRRRHDRRRARAGHRRVPRPLPRRDPGDLPGQAGRQPRSPATSPRSSASASTR